MLVNKKELLFRVNGVRWTLRVKEGLTVIEKKNINAILTKDLYNILEKKGLFQDFINGNLTCTLCEEIITPDNFGAVFIDNNQLLLCCSNMNCLEMIRGK